MCMPCRRRTASPHLLSRLALEPEVGLDHKVDPGALQALCEGVELLHGQDHSKVRHWHKVSVHLQRWGVEQVDAKGGEDKRLLGMAVIVERAQAIASWRKFRVIECYYVV